MAAIGQISKMLEEAGISEVFGLKAVYVPIPPSKTKEDLLYDDRLIQVLSKVKEGELAIKEIIKQEESTLEYHTSNEKRDYKKIKANYTIDESQCECLYDIIVIFDDMLTTGAHFKAAKELLQERFPTSDIKGLFIAHRISFLQNL